MTFQSLGEGCAYTTVYHDTCSVALNMHRHSALMHRHDMIMIHPPWKEPYARCMVYRINDDDLPRHMRSALASGTSRL